MKNFYCKIFFFICTLLIFSCIKFSSRNNNNDYALFLLLVNSHMNNNSSIEFSGTKYSSVAFSILDNPSINIGNSNFTIEFWIKIKSISSNTNCSNTTDVFTNGDIIFDRDIFGTPDYGDFGFSVMQDRKIAFSFRNNDNSYTLCTNPLDLNKWYYIALTKSNTQIRIFLNGNLEDSYSITGNSNFSYNTNCSTSYIADPLFSFGAEKHTAWGGENFTAYHFNGLLDEFRISSIVRNISLPTGSFILDSYTIALFRFNNNINSETTIQNIQSKGIGFSMDTPF